ncbi:hypothetical protein ADUPG1_012964 [Aduncisulcus paluster]|uniref:Uncharacterized protein n=1 Tax=Aduncisulcus paluster TaxID=2918883 RepID=A0ABQ5K1A2_9EUKA|nr:hypothetical protein ADUPG1_012964 [Aduncisulcus paluster]
MDINKIEKAVTLCVNGTTFESAEAKTYLDSVSSQSGFVQHLFHIILKNGNIRIQQMASVFLRQFLGEKIHELSSSDRRFLFQHIFDILTLTHRVIVKQGAECLELLAESFYPEEWVNLPEQLLICIKSHPLNSFHYLNAIPSIFDVPRDIKMGGDLLTAVSSYISFDRPIELLCNAFVAYTSLLAGLHQCKDFPESLPTTFASLSNVIQVVLKITSTDAITPDNIGALHCAIKLLTVVIQLYQKQLGPEYLTRICGSLVAVLRVSTKKSSSEIVSKYPPASLGFSGDALTTRGIVCQILETLSFFIETNINPEEVIIPHLSDAIKCIFHHICFTIDDMDEWEEIETFSLYEDEESQLLNPRVISRQLFTSMIRHFGQKIYKEVAELLLDTIKRSFSSISSMSPSALAAPIAPASAACVLEGCLTLFNVFCDEVRNSGSEDGLFSGEWWGDDSEGDDYGADEGDFGGDGDDEGGSFTSGSGKVELDDEFLNNFFTLSFREIVFPLLSSPTCPSLIRGRCACVAVALLIELDRASEAFGPVFENVSNCVQNGKSKLEVFLGVRSITKLCGDSRFKKMNEIIARYMGPVFPSFLEFITTFLKPFMVSVIDSADKDGSGGETDTRVVEVLLDALIFPAKICPNHALAQHEMLASLVVSLVHAFGNDPYIPEPICSLLAVACQGENTKHLQLLRNHIITTLIPAIMRIDPYRAENVSILCCCCEVLDAVLRGGCKQGQRNGLPVRLALEGSAVSKRDEVQVNSSDFLGLLKIVLKMYEVDDSSLRVSIVRLMEGIILSLNGDDFSDFRTTPVNLESAGLGSQSIESYFSIICCNLVKNISKAEDTNDSDSLTLADTGLKFGYTMLRCGCNISIGVDVIRTLFSSLPDSVDVCTLTIKGSLCVLLCALMERGPGIDFKAISTAVCCVGSVVGASLVRMCIRVLKTILTSIPKHAFSDLTFSKTVMSSSSSRYLRGSTSKEKVNVTCKTIVKFIQQLLSIFMVEMEGMEGDDDDDGIDISQLGNSPANIMSRAHPDANLNIIKEIGSFVGGIMKDIQSGEGEKGIVLAQLKEILSDGEKGCLRKITSKF